MIVASGEISHFQDFSKRASHCVKVMIYMRVSSGRRDHLIALTLRHPVEPVTRIMSEIDLTIIV